MTKQIRVQNPETLATPNGFSHVAVDTTGRRVFISGQVAYDGSGQIVGAGDLARQTVQTLENIGHALQSVNLGFEHVIKLTYFVVNLDSEAARTIREARKPFLVQNQMPASTMVGVASLAREGLLLEVEAEAVLPAN
jgi:enamine deaminase RidA (YjgF/YER057c/UK114 family)